LRRRLRVLRGLGCFRWPGLLGAARGGRLFSLPADTEHAVKHAKHPADRTGRLVARLGSLLNSLDQPLRVQGLRNAKKHDNDSPKHKAQSRSRGSGGCRVDHYLVSSDFDPGRVNQGGMRLGNIILIRMERVHRRASLIEARKTCRTSQLHGVGTAARWRSGPSVVPRVYMCSAILGLGRRRAAEALTTPTPTLVLEPHQPDFSTGAPNSDLILD